MKLTHQTLEKIEELFKKEDKYLLSEQQEIFCPQVNGLTTLCLSELGYQDLARKNSNSFINSTLYNQNAKLFYRETNLDGRIVNINFNSGKNAIGALSLAITGHSEEAREIMHSLEKCPLYDEKLGLFYREYNPETEDTNHLLLTQSNLWAALAYSTVKKTDQARKIMRCLENAKYNPVTRLFTSQNCRYRDSKVATYVDDQALAVLAYLSIGEHKQANELLIAVLESPLRDTNSQLFNSSFSHNFVDRTKSTYKNSFMAFALGKTGLRKELQRVQQGLVRELYDEKKQLFRQSSKEDIAIPDNSALALVALEYEVTRHDVF